MSVKRIVAIVCIFLTAAAGWAILGTASVVRSHDSSSRLTGAVYSLWGTPITQPAPSFAVKIPGTARKRAVLPSANKIDVALYLEQRRKGLIWYPTYVTDFSGSYAITNSDAVRQNVRVHFHLPSKTATYRDLMVWIDDVAKDVEVSPEEGVSRIITVAPGETRTFKVSYRTRGLREWRYALAQGGGRVRDLDMVVRTDFDAVDFADGSRAPSSNEAADKGRVLRWSANDMITRQHVGIVMPERVNPGPLSARMTFFAPVCLLFFFVLIASIGILRRIDIHPMHYLFVAAGFFAFHLLFAYLVDVINVHLAFLITSTVSVGLVIAYLSAALGKSFPWKIAAAGQLFYLVLFSYSFFLTGLTGLTIAIGSVATLAVLMRMTAGLDWSQVFAPAKPLPST